MITVLMYHAIPPDAAPAAQADAHYSVQHDVFARHIELIRSMGARPASVRSLLDAGADDGVAVTFDDGHETNFTAAAMLRQAGGSADFFVNPSTVGSPGFLTWEQLREMASWGMSIQSHGMHHRFLDELTPAEVEAELAESKRAIEQHLGGTVTLYAPAGGRLAPGTQEMARRLGYARICSSRVGLWDPGARAAFELPRLAMLASTSQAQLARWLRQSPLEMGWQRSRYLLLRSAKRALGNGAYVRLRQLVVHPTDS